MSDNNGAIAVWGPDALAASEDSRVHRGLLAAGSRSGSVVPMGGTSVAAPQVARWIASRIEQGRNATRQEVRSRAAADDTDPNKPPLERGGSGRIRGLPILSPRHFEE